MIRHILLLSACFFLLEGTSCTDISRKTRPDKSQVSDTTTANIILMRYEYNYIYLDGIVNDSIPMSVKFDTGAYGFTISNTLKPEFQDKLPVTLKIGSYQHIFNNIKYSGATFFNAMKRNLGKDGILLGWDFFENKVIEMSYNKQYIKVLENTLDLTSHDCIELILKGTDFIVPISIHMQNRLYHVHLVLDTGLDETLVTCREFVPGLNYSDAYKGSGKGMNNIINKLDAMNADSLKIGNNTLKNITIGIFEKNIFTYGNPPTKYEGLLGNKFLDNFSVVLDFKNKKLYLKPI